MVFYREAMYGFCPGPPEAETKGLRSSAWGLPRRSSKERRRVCGYKALCKMQNVWTKRNMIIGNIYCMER
jgi:hypothetical protein